jgi:hypothetical protein
MLNATNKMATVDSTGWIDLAIVRKTILNPS